MANLNNRNKLDMVSVFDLMGNTFYIPDYQRGYRWTESEAEKLLDDLTEFFNQGEDTGFYCMQPLVVFYDKKNKWWVIIDGQQRLTTLFLILNQDREHVDDLLDHCKDKTEMFNIKYQSRPDSAVFLSNLDEEKSEENIDYYHMSKVNKKINDYLSVPCYALPDKIINYDNNNKKSVKFIWYDITEEINSNIITQEEKFSDLNIGKIPLTNAELVKALFLNSVSEDESEQVRIVTEWDNIEHSLQNDEFWSFIYGKDDDTYATRIEFLFDNIKRKNQSEKNEFFTFDEYSNDIKKYKKEAVEYGKEMVKEKKSEALSLGYGKIDNEKVKKIQRGAEEEYLKDKVKEAWKEISTCYYLYKGWYDDKNLYHIIGFLRYMKKSIRDIMDVFDKEKDTESFYKKLKKIAIYSLNTKKEEIKDLTYNDNGEKIRHLLVLFNILSIVNNKKDNVRFSFNEFYRTAYDIEHIRPQTQKDISGNDRKLWITCMIKYFSGISYDDKYSSDYEAYKNDVKDAVKKQKTEIANGKTAVSICSELLVLLDNNESVMDLYDWLNDNVFKQNDIFQNMDNIGNLTLLDVNTNRRYHNAFFPVKRSDIYRSEYELGIYILPCTRNVFSKMYSERIYDQMNWYDDDAEAYMNMIEEVVYG